MTRLTTQQKRIIAALFRYGTSMDELAYTWKRPVTKIEAIIRQAMKERG